MNAGNLFFFRTCALAGLMSISPTKGWGLMVWFVIMCVWSFVIYAADNTKNES
jgi:hypothetical protein